MSKKLSIINLIATLSYIPGWVFMLLVCGMTFKAIGPDPSAIWEILALILFTLVTLNIGSLVLSIIGIVKKVELTINIVSCVAGLIVLFLSLLLIAVALIV